MALVADLVLPPAPLPERATARSTLWIASVLPPTRVQTWPVLVPIPPGWHEVSATEAQRLRRTTVTGLSFLIETLPTSAASETAALTSSAPETARRREGRQPRTPRSPRTPRKSRTPRTVRASRLFRPERTPRRPRPPRKPRAARKPRTPRTRRPRNYKTKQPPGICKGPACTCWTPGGCVGSWYLEALPSFKGSDCYRGPCFSYEACVSEKCQVHSGCLVNTILQFWARQYRAAVAYAVPAVQVAAQRARRRVQPALDVIVETVTVAAPTAPTVVSYTAGCPPGWRWLIGLTGVRCAPFEAGGFPATRAQVIAALGYDPGGPGFTIG